MESFLVFARKIVQVDNYSFKITWTDEKEQIFPLSYLQRNCPCISCGEKERDPLCQEEVRATKVVSVGSYALRINFTSGCSRGIFTFHFLRTLGV